MEKLALVLFCNLFGKLGYKYLKHWFLFVFSIQIFLKDKIDEDEFILAEKALRNFVLNIEEMYGSRFMTFNVHTLLHIPHFIIKGILKNLIRGTQCVSQQICKNYLRLKCIKSIFENHLYQNNYYSIKAHELMKRYLYKNLNHCFVDIRPRLKLLGTSSNVHLSVINKMLIEQFLRKEVAEIANSYKRITYNGIEYHSCEYNRLKKRENHTALLTNNKFLKIKDILLVNSTNDEKICVIIGYKLVKCSNNVHMFKLRNLSSNLFCSVIEPSNELICVRPEMLLVKCLNLPFVHNNRCLFPLNRNL